MSNKRSSSSNDLSLLPPSAFQMAMEKMNLSVDEPNEQKYTCTPKALEILRHCQGQFVALVASELAICDEDNVSKNDAVDDVNFERVRNINANNVMAALKRLEFHDIISQLENDNVKKGSATVHDKEPKSKVQIKKREKRKRSAVLKGSDLSEEELIREQDRLIALSIQRAKDQLTNK